MRADRLNEMEQYILGRENVSLEELCVQFSISMNTVRRDIAELLNRGNVRKVYGGVSSNLQHRPLGFSVRERKNSEAKQIIGQLAARLVNNGSSIFLDSGSTTPNIVRHLGEKNGVTVITHSLTALYEAANWTDYGITAHALKSTSLTIGAEELSGKAKELEMAGKSADEAFIRENHSVLLQMYAEVCDSIAGL